MTTQPQNAEWTQSAETRTAFEQYLDERRMTRAEAAKKLGITETRLSKYLNLHLPDSTGAVRTPEPDMANIERKITNLLRHVARQAADRLTLFQNSVSEQVNTTLKQIRRTGDIGLIDGDAGIGKSCGCELYCANNPDTILITVTDYASSPSAIETAIFEEFIATSADKHRGKLRKMAWLESQLKGAERLIIIDNAHQLRFKSLRLLFNFHDATRIPLGLVGNPEVLDVLRRNDQLFSRIGAVQHVRIRNDSEEVAKAMIERHAPASGKELLDHAVNIIGCFGHLRTLRKQLTLAADIHRASGKMTWENAFTAAGNRLLKCD